MKSQNGWTSCTIPINHISSTASRAPFIIYGTFAQRSLQPFTENGSRVWRYLLDVFKGLNKGVAQGVQVGLWLLQMCDGLIKSHPCWVRLFLLAAAVASLFALLTKLAEGSGGSLYHLRPRLGAQLEAAYRGWGAGGWKQNYENSVGDSGF